MGGWYVGVAVGVVVVLVVVVIVGLLLQVAARLSEQAGMASEALDHAQAHTLPLWDVATTNRTTRSILEGAVRAREAVEQS